MSTSGFDDATHSIDPVPETARTSTAGHQFWIWCGANIAPINWVLGALGVKLGLGLADTVTVLTLGLSLVLIATFLFIESRTPQPLYAILTCSRSAVAPGRDASSKTVRRMR